MPGEIYETMHLVYEQPDKELTLEVLTRDRLISSLNAGARV